MVDALGIITGDLGPTRTYQRRRFCWLPEREDVPCADHRLGTLTLIVSHGERAGCKVEVDHYRAEWHTQGQPWRGVLLLNLSPENTDGELYHVFHDGIEYRCGCTAADCKVDNCKHRSWMEYMVSLGVFPGIPVQEQAA